MNIKRRNIILGVVLAFMLATSPKFSWAQAQCDDFLYSALLLTGAWAGTEEEPAFFPTNKYGLSYALLENLDVDPSTMKVGEFVEREVLSQNVLFYREDSTSIRPFYVILDKEQYYMLSSEHEEEFCDYRASTFLFIPPEDYFKIVEKPFSFSLKNNLIEKLNEQLDYQLDKDEFENYCSLLKYLEGTE